jgi:uncharacterized repeat protein (TIGR01451 family)
VIRRILRLIAIAALAATTAAAIAAAPAGAVVPAPHWTITSMAGPSHFVPGDSHNIYLVTITNTGGAPSDGSPITITDVLPPGLTQKDFEEFGSASSLRIGDESGAELNPCDPGPPVTCTVNRSLLVGEDVVAFVPVDVAAPEGSTVTNQVSVSGGGAPDASASEQTPISNALAGFGFQSSDISLTDVAGEPETQAGAHPYQLRVGFQLNTGHTKPDSIHHGDAIGSPREVVAKLPPGVVLNPAATPERCTEAQFESIDGGKACPAASTVGLIQPTLDIFGLADDLGIVTPIYNLVPPPGVPAAFGFDPNAMGLFVHLLGGVNSAGEYELSADAREIPQFGRISGVVTYFWGDPTDPAHDGRRGECGYANGIGGHCPAPRADLPLLTMPSACQESLTASLEVDSWQEPANFISASPQTLDSDGNPIGVTGCGALDFKPTLKARPTTNVADSPSGLEVDLHVPQTNSLNTLATANLRKTVVTLPAGMSLNPAAANGLDACTSAQIGLTTPVGQTPIHFSAEPPSCPNAAKVGTVDVDTPLLDDPLHGAVYIAEPHDNPFGSLLAIYVVVQGQGIVIKLAGHVEADPQTGRLVTTFDENPQLPFSDFRLDFKAGPHGVLRTPPACGNYSTTSQLTPWSGSPPATPHDDYSFTQGPGNGCASSEADQPFSTTFDAGSFEPIAGAFTPFLLNLARADGTQQLSRVTVSPPPGLVGKLAGTPPCSEAALSAAAAKSGTEERVNPSCPAASQVGVVDVAVGAGPDPYNTQAKVYLAGPYKGAPLSFAIVTPATAGPFDLGTVVVRTAVGIDPVTTQITATADPLPTILEGIPLDIRSARLKLDKPSFTLNGTSCDPDQVTGSLLSTLGQAAQVANRFQLAECTGLAFKPKLSLRLKGSTKRTSNPKLIATLNAQPGEANIAMAQVKLPKAAFIDNDHIGSPCTRVQFSAGGGGGAGCPDSSLVGHAEAATPLLDNSLSGNVYLRTNPEHLLPDLVAVLRGPDSQPIEIDLAGKTDSVKQALRNTFEAVPDAPVSSFRLELFGGRKGLIELSDGLCSETRATVLLNAQNGDTYDTHPLVRTSCPKRHHGHRGHRHRHRAR